MKSTDEMTDEELDRTGEKIAEVLQLKRDREYKDRWQTTWGNKTSRGIALTVSRIMDERGAE